MGPLEPRHARRAATVRDPPARPAIIAGVARWWQVGGAGSGGVEAMGALGEGRRIAGELRAGLDGPGAPAAVRRLRTLLGAEVVGLCGLSGDGVWSGRPTDPAAAAELVAAVLRTDARAVGTGRLVALPVHTRDELVGAMVAAGEGLDRAALREAAAWVGEALERARLEASAEVAEQAELRALRAEISPHFVYNSLTAIASFVESDPERARDLLLDFAEYTRHSLARGGDYTTVAGEFAAIEAYLDAGQGRARRPAEGAAADRPGDPARRAALPRAAAAGGERGAARGGAHRRRRPRPGAR